MSENRCTCFWCSFSPWALPSAAALTAVLTMVILGGGRYPVYVDVMAYTATALMVYWAVSTPLWKVRFRHEDKARSAE